MKLYRYRPITELLFKELLHQEIYLASYLELNDPLDLTTSLDFRPNASDVIDSDDDGVGIIRDTFDIPIRAQAVARLDVSADEHRAAGASRAVEKLCPFNALIVGGVGAEDTSTDEVRAIDEISGIPLDDNEYIVDICIESFIIQFILNPERD